MKKSEKMKLGMVYVLVFLIALYMDMQNGRLEDGSVVYRDEVGGESVDVDLCLDADNALKNYDVTIEVEPRRVTEEEAEIYFSNVIECIQDDFSDILKSVPLQNSYAEGIVEAEWNFSPTGIVGMDGTVLYEKIPEDGLLMTATVILECGAYEKIHRFPFELDKPKLTLQEKMEQELSTWIEEQQNMEGVGTFQLPKELGGISVEWSEKREFLSVKIVFLEIVSVFLLLFAKKKEQEEAEKKKRQKMELQYPDIVNQLLILLEAGMATRQAWHRIAYQYKEKQKRHLVEESDVYTAILQLDRRLQEGEKERAAYEGFARELDVMCYRRLIRLLVNNLEKGSKDICKQLSLEAKEAYNQRLLLAKKLGEEASTKMLVPMMFMMVLVMVIVMAPAIIGFSI